MEESLAEEKYASSYGRIIYHSARLDLKPL